MSASPRVFVTGASGYIGGHLVGRIVEKHPEWHLVVLVRNEEQKNTILARWPQLEVVGGDLGDSALMIKEGSKADVVLQTGSADHIPGVQSLIQGLSERKPTPGYFIHIAGTGMLHETPNGFGQPSDKIYHDTTDLAEITSFPVEGHVHRDVDLAILEAQKRLHVPTAIVSPPLIHGVGKGPIKTRSIQIPALAEATLKRGKGFKILEGQNIWDHVHLDDLCDAFILLTEEALKPNGGNAQWGDEGYYFAEAGEFKWGDVSAAIAKIAADEGLIKTAEVDKLSVDEAATQHPWAPLIWGGNCRSRSDRLHKLGWKPHGPSVFESLPAMVNEEARTLGTQLIGMASLEDAGAGGPPPFPKPCVACRRRKIKCDKLTRPCSNCARSKQLCMYDGDEPQAETVRQSIEGTLSTDIDVRDRLARLERLMERVMVGESAGVVSRTGARPGLAVAKDTLPEASGVTRVSPNSSSPPPSFHANIDPITNPVLEAMSAPVGQILFQELHAAYFDSDFWAGLITEIEDLRRLFDPPSDYSPPSWVSISTLGMSPPPSTDLTYAHPTLEESNMLCKLFFESVNPFVRVLHQAHFGRELDRYRRGSLDWPREFEALLFAIYLLTINSLRAEVVQTVFSIPKDTLVANYKNACQVALSNVDFFKTGNIHTVQALLHYLTFLFQQNLYQDANALLGVAARLAQTMGLHRDPSHFPYSPWVCEIRRRIWNRLCCLDGMALGFYGAESCLPATSDSRPPQNANDLDWHASRFAKPSSVPSSTSFTDMTFALVHRVIADTTRSLARIDPLEFEKKETILRQTETDLRINYLHSIDKNIPSHNVVVAFAEIRIESLRLSNQHRQSQRTSSGPSSPEKQQVFIAAIELLEAFEYHSKTFASYNWEWAFETIVPWLAIAIVLTELPHVTRPSDIDRAQRQIELNFQRFSDLSKLVSCTPMWKLLVQLRQHMQEQPSSSPSSQRGDSIAVPPPQQTAAMDFTDDLMLDFGVSAPGSESLVYEDQFMLQDMQDLPWLNTQMPY